MTYDGWGYPLTPIKQSGEKKRTGVRGEDHHNCKLTKDQVAQIVERLKTGEKQKSIAYDFGVCGQTISKINLGARWRSLNLVEYRERTIRSYPPRPASDCSKEPSPVEALPETSAV